MKLEVNTGRVVDDLNEEIIEEALSSLTEDAFPDPQDCLVGGSFAMLHKSENHYIKADRIGPDRFRLHYSDGSLEGGYYSCVDDDLELSAVQRAFQSYFNGDDRWRTELEWQPFENPFKPKTSGCLGFVAAFAFLFTVMLCLAEWSRRQITPPTEPYSPAIREPSTPDPSASPPSQASSWLHFAR